ncbi:hypothetical protein I5Q82_14250 [Acutalibacter muris]|uniref:Uncharacterized protein n=1 Tax=Acutalibacter muris TaxID=1796620 RepID=A0AA92L588_9FIRM|nr:hypothetical protein [Acutalibacter muris]ANU53409.1 hypothetical protein A4V00_04805 [Hungateiclostridiaceae bacterium KB18]QQR29206.1 hypothetical protein I5Q82_14250 [Acutalibacter muris]
MWLTRKLSGEKAVRLHSGQVEAGGLSVQGERLYEEPEQLMPYGLMSVAEAGRQAVMLEGYCAGVAGAPDSDIRAGEVRLYSAGGAEIYLENSGRVIINGQVFEPKEG